jgi:hypothetical protein
MEKSTKLIIGTVFLMGGLIAANKTNNKNIDLVNKDDIGNKTLSYIIAGIGAYILYKSIK